MALLPVFHTPLGLAVCTGFVGFFFSAAGPVNAEVCFIVTNAKLYSFGFGYVVVASAVAWILGAPVAGNLIIYTTSGSKRGGW